MLRYSIAVLLAFTAAPAFAQSEKETSCGHQADLVQAIVDARLNGVKERDLQEELSKTATWPDNYTKAVVPLFAPFVYEQKRRDLRKSDLRASTFTQCMSLP